VVGQSPASINDPKGRVLLILKDIDESTFKDKTCNIAEE
jgi:hypothetical protein